MQLCRGLRSAPCALGTFIRDSLTLDQACTVEGAANQPLWPVPPVRWRWTDARDLNPRRRRRHRLLKSCHECVNIILCSLNWECLGFPAHPPEHARVGAPISNAQHGIIERLESMVMHLLHTPDFNGDDLGRAKEKFSGIINSIQELPWCKLKVGGPNRISSACAERF